MLFGGAFLALADLVGRTVGQPGGDPDRRGHRVLRRAVLRAGPAHDQPDVGMTGAVRRRAARLTRAAGRPRSSSTASTSTSPPGEWVTVIGPNGAGKSTLVARRRRPACASPAARSSSAGRRRPRCRGATGPGRWPPWRSRRSCRPGCGCSTTCCSAARPYIPPLGRESASDLAAVDEVLDRAGPGPRSPAGCWTRCPAASGSGCSWPGRWPRSAPLLLLDEPTSALDIGHQQEVLDLVDELRRDRGPDRAGHDARPVDGGRVRRPAGAAGRGPGGRRPAPPREVLTEELLADHYRVRVKVIDGEHGPLVVPVRGRSLATGAGAGWRTCRPADPRGPRTGPSGSSSAA